MEKTMTETPRAGAELLAGTSQGKCDVTLTERYANPGCVCATYAGNKGPCRSWEAGVNGRCVYCDHTMACHLKMCQAALASPPAPASAEVEQVASALENGVLPIGFLDKAATMLRRLDAERGELKRIAKYADIPVVASEPLETCCFCNKTIQLGQAYDRLDAGRYCHLGCWPPAAALQAAPAARDVERVEQAAEAWVLAERALHKDNSKANAHRWAEAETVFRVAIAALPHDAPAVAEELPVPPDARARAAQREPLGDTKRGT
jgi:hypothetical protein